MAAKGSWFEVECKECLSTGECQKNDIGFKPCNNCKTGKKSYNIYKDPVTDDGIKKSLKGLINVRYCSDNKCCLVVKEECTPEEESQGLLQIIYEDGKFYNQSSLTEIRQKLLQNNV